MRPRVVSQAFSRSSTARKALTTRSRLERTRAVTLDLSGNDDEGSETENTASSSSTFPPPDTDTATATDADDEGWWAPPVSPATGLVNQKYKWRAHQQQQQRIRYQVTGPPNGRPLLLVHGLLVNADHWRHLLTTFPTTTTTTSSSTTNTGNTEAAAAAATNTQGSSYRIYALDLLGCGYSDKPRPDSPEAQACNGENGRFLLHHHHHPSSPADEKKEEKKEQDPGADRPRKVPGPSIVSSVDLGSATGQLRQHPPVNIDLRHPLGSPYNFYTWSELLADFCREVIFPQSQRTTTTTTPEEDSSRSFTTQKVTLVCNSIGTITAFQAVLDHPHWFDGVFCLAPNFRELHSAEMPWSAVSMPLLRTVQAALRKYGQPLFEAAARPDTVRRILQTPYAVKTAVDDTLVQVLLDPLLTPGASTVVFDTLSYSAGPLPEWQLAQFPAQIPVWIVYGQDDPWTPARRVSALRRLAAVQHVVALPGVGHCPHDEAPEAVHTLLLQFLQQQLQQPQQQQQPPPPPLPDVVVVVDDDDDDVERGQREAGPESSVTTTIQMESSSSSSSSSTG